MSRDDRGASAVEYGLLAAGIAAVVAVVILPLGRVVVNDIGHIGSQIGSGITVPSLTMPVEPTTGQPLVIAPTNSTPVASPTRTRKPACRRPVHGGKKVHASPTPTPSAGC